MAKSRPATPTSTRRFTNYWLTGYTLLLLVIEYDRVCYQLAFALLLLGLKHGIRHYVYRFTCSIDERTVVINMAKSSAWRRTARLR